MYEKWVHGCTANALSPVYPSDSGIALATNNPGMYVYTDILYVSTPPWLSVNTLHMHQMQCIVALGWRMVRMTVCV